MHKVHIVILQGFRIEGNIIKNEEPNRLVCIFRENGRKEFQLNNDPYKKFSEHIGKFPCVFIAPDDVQLITEGSEKRRGFFGCYSFATLPHLPSTFN